MALTENIMRYDDPLKSSLWKNAYGIESRFTMKNKRRIPPLLFSRDDCAEALGCGKSKIDEVLQSGKLRSFKWNGQRKVHSKDLWNFAWNLRDAGTRPTDLDV